MRAAEVWPQPAQFEQLLFKWSRESLKYWMGQFA